MELKELAESVIKRLNFHFQSDYAAIQVKGLDEPEYCNERALYQDRYEGNDVWTIGRCRRRGADNIPRHLEEFTMVECARRWKGAGRVGPTVASALEEVLRLYSLLAGLERKDLEILKYDFNECAEKGRDESRSVEVGDPVCFRGEKLDIIPEVKQEEGDYLLRLDSALSCFDLIPGGPHRLLVLENMPAHPYAPTESRTGKRCEVYNFRRNEKMPMEIANIYEHNLDSDDLKCRGVEIPVVWPERSIDYGMGLERCLLAAEVAEDISEFSGLCELAESTCQ